MVGVELPLGRVGKIDASTHPQSRQPTHATSGSTTARGIVDCAHAAAACGMVGRLDISAYPGVHRSVVIEVDGGLDLFAAKGGQGVLLKDFPSWAQAAPPIFSVPS